MKASANERWTCSDITPPDDALLAKTVALRYNVSSFPQTSFQSLFWSKGLRLFVLLFLTFGTTSRKSSSRCPTDVWNPIQNDHGINLSSRMRGQNCWRSRRPPSLWLLAACGYFRAAAVRLQWRNRCCTIAPQPVRTVLMRNKSSTNKRLLSCHFLMHPVCYDLYPVMPNGMDMWEQDYVKKGSVGERRNEQRWLVLLQKCSTLLCISLEIFS